MFDDKIKKKQFKKNQMLKDLIWQQIMIIS
jgi:hypothetical protein